MYLFVTPNVSNLASKKQSDAVGKRTVRSQVMKDYCRRKRESDPGNDREPPPGPRRRHRANTKSATIVRQIRSRDLIWYHSPEYTPAMEIVACAIGRCDLSQLKSCLSSGLLNRGSHGRAYCRTVIMANFVYGYLGDNAKDSIGLKSTVKYWESPEYDAMRAAGDAHALLHLGFQADDATIIGEAHSRHNVAVNLLRRDMEGDTLSMVAAVAACALLSCESYSLVSSGPNATYNHLMGILAILKNTRHQTATLEMRAFVFRKFRQISLLQSLVSQRAVVGDHLFWLCGQIQTSSDIEALMELVIQLPAMLEAAELVRSSGELDGKMIDGVRSRLLRLEREMQQWLVRFVCTPHPEGGNGRANGAYHPPKPHSQPEPVIFKTSDRPSIPQSALRFPSFMNAIHHAFYWTCLLVLQQALVALPGHQRPQHDSISSTFALQPDLKSDTETTADLLCATIPFLLQTAGGAINKAHSIRAQLYFAAQWYAETGNEMKLQWCHEVEKEWRDRMPFIEWDALVSQSFQTMYWLV